MGGGRAKIVGVWLSKTFVLDGMKQMNMHNRSLLKKVLAIQKTSSVLFDMIFAKWARHSFINFKINKQTLLTMLKGKI